MVAPHLVGTWATESRQEEDDALRVAPPEIRLGQNLVLRRSARPLTSLEHGLGSRPQSNHLDLFPVDELAGAR
jgi:hypothetical protein